MAADRRQQILRLEGALWESQRAQQLDSARPLAGRLGKEGHHRLSSRESVGRVSATDVHDAGSRCCGRQSFQRLESLEPGWPLATVEPEAIVKRHRIPATLKTTRTLARRCLLHQHFGYVLLPVQCAGRRQPLYRALGNPGIDEGTRSGDYSPTGSREVSSCQAPRHFRQRPTIHCQRLQRIHPHLWDDACENVAVLSAIEWENRTLAQVHKGRVHPAGSTLVAGGCAANRGVVGESLQYGSSSQRDWLHCA